MKSRMIAFILAIVIIMIPVYASALYYTDRAAWEAAVGSYADVIMPKADIATWQSIDLPVGTDNFMNFNAPLKYLGGYGSESYKPDADPNPNYYANGTFYQPGAVPWQPDLLPVSAFGLHMQPFSLAILDNGPLDVTINLYTQVNGMLSQSFDIYENKFFGWVGDDVTGFSTWCGAPYTLSNLVIGAPDSVPEPAAMLLIGTGFIGLAVLGRKRLLKK